MKKVHVIGAGLAGSEAAWQLAKRDIEVVLHEMRPKKMTEAHQTKNFAEMVCSNTFRSKKLVNAAGVLKEEMKYFDSLIMEAALHAEIPAGGALAVDREKFSLYVSETLTHHPKIEIIYGEVTDIPDEPTIIATGPLTSKGLNDALTNLLDEASLHFFDAVAPIITKDSINMDVCYYKNRYEDDLKGDYINCPMNEEEYNEFYRILTGAKTAEIKDFEENVFEGCMPVETMASRGYDTLRYGPLKPVGLRRDSSHKPFAVVQLRQDDARETMFNLVGFQTHLTFGEQKRLIRSIPGLEGAEIIRYGVMHKNSFIKAPSHLKKTYQTIHRDDLFIAGQLSGVEGYIESAGSGLVAGINMARLIQEKPLLTFPKDSILGAQADYLETANPKHFQPMNANFGLLEPLGFKHRKKERKTLYASRAIEAIKAFKEETHE